MFFFVFFFQFKGAKFSRLVTFQVFISSKRWTQYYLALMLFLQGAGCITTIIHTIHVCA